MRQRPSAATVSDLLREGTASLREADIPSPGLDAEILLREVLEATREQLFDALPDPIRSNVATDYRELIARRLSGVPVAYIIGRREFYGHDFIVNEHVLVPRPETEYLVEFALSWLTDRGDRQMRIVDVGTGSGAIAISVALAIEGRHQIIASDVSQEALEVARTNASMLGADVALIEGSVLDWLEEPVDLILANLPYLRPDQAHPGIDHEPGVALYAGDDGFTLNQALLKQAPSILRRPGAMIMELDPDQAQLARETASFHFPEAEIEVRQDLAETSRYLIVEQK